MSGTTLFENAKIVLADEVMDGWLAVEDGLIKEVASGSPPERGIDLEGDYLLPGLVELHTDHLEAHAMPRPKVKWHPLSAVVAYDAQIAAAGITTVFDSVRAGSDVDEKSDAELIWSLTSALNAARDEGLLRVDHLTHIRCEISASDVIEQVTRLQEQQPIGLMSLMDHTPGARQFADIATWKTYFGGKSGRSSAELDALIDARCRLFDANYKTHRQQLVALANTHGTALASHDDTTQAHVDESLEDGVALAEFPTTIEAAEALHSAGIKVLMGAPNVVRGGSHSGNVAAVDLAKRGTLDILSSDYVPASLLMGAFELARQVDSISLPAAVATVAASPAAAAGLDDRGEIKPGLRADLIRVHELDGLPVVREVYCNGRRSI